MPAALLRERALWRRRQRRPLVAVAGVPLEMKRVAGVHIGVIGLAFNVSICVAGAWLTGPRAGPRRV